MSNEIKEKFTKGEWFTKVCSNRGEFESVSVYYPHGFLCSANVIKVDDTRLQDESWLDMRNRTKQQRIDASLESNANQYLIASAPCMYKLLERWVDSTDCIADNYQDGLIEETLELLAKARGEHIEQGVSNET